MFSMLVKLLKLDGVYPRLFKHSVFREKRNVTDKPVRLLKWDAKLTGTLDISCRRIYVFQRFTITSTQFQIPRTKKMGVRTMKAK